MALSPKSITTFKENFRKGGARANQFKVALRFPGSVASGASSAKGEFLCFAATLPGAQIDVAPAQYRGRVVPLAGERQFQPWTISVFNDEDFEIRNSFELWMNTINNVKHNSGVVAPIEYTADLNVMQMNRNDEILKNYKIVDAWPTNMSDIQLDFSANNQVETFQVTFVYSYWELDKNAE